MQILSKDYLNVNGMLLCTVYPIKHYISAHLIHKREMKE